MERSVSLFRNGRNQALRIPRDLEMPGEKAVLTPLPEGGFTVRPVTGGLIAAIHSLKPLAPEDWPDPIEDLAAEPVDL